MEEIKEIQIEEIVINQDIKQSTDTVNTDSVNTDTVNTDTVNTDLVNTDTVNTDTVNTDSVNINSSTSEKNNNTQTNTNANTNNIKTCSGNTLGSTKKILEETFTYIINSVNQAKYLNIDALRENFTKIIEFSQKHNLDVNDWFNEEFILDKNRFFAIINEYENQSRYYAELNMISVAKE